MSIEVSMGFGDNACLLAKQSAVSEANLTTMRKCCVVVTEGVSAVKVEESLRGCSRGCSNRRHQEIR